MRILLDAMLGGLRPYLRICGHDAAYALDRGVEDDDALVAWAHDEGRVLVTRDRELAGRAGESIRLTERDVRDQLRELHDAGVDLVPADRPRWCGRCNGPLDRATPGVDRPEYVPDDVEDLWRCRNCGRYFWRGGHWEDVAETLSAVRSE